MNSDLKLEVGETIKASVKNLWHALTSPEMIKEYFWGTEVVTDWQAGSEILFKGTWEHTTYEDKGNILDIQPGKLFKYSYRSSFWGDDIGPDERSIITYQLEKTDDNHTKLTILQEGFKDEKSRGHSIENWKGILNNIKELLEKQAG